MPPPSHTIVAESEAIQNFLKSVYVLQQQTERASTNAMAQALDISPPSVTDMAQRLGVLGLVDYRKHRGVALTPEGEREALNILRRHRLLELYLVEELDYPLHEVHDEAERLEHAVSDRFIERIAHKLGDPPFDPHGDPIPSADGEIIRRDLCPLTELTSGIPAVVARYKRHETEPLRHILEIGFRLGAPVQVLERAPFDGPITVQIGDQKRVIGHKIGSLILVEAQDPQQRAR